MIFITQHELLYTTQSLEISLLSNMVNPHPGQPPCRGGGTLHR